MSQCPCNSGVNYSECCDVFHSESQLAPTAEKLMRARYSAFAKNKIPFIAESHAPGTTDFDKDEATKWATSSTWKGLEIVNTNKGQETDQTGTVEFKAMYADDKDNDYLHHEISTFKKQDGKWFYLDGQIVGNGPYKRATPKLGRNEPCSCGSGKKYKKCCGA
ncbi:MAG: YchJ family protein [Halobacteriovoraceae bacterium]|jgi:SEC-C motif domain protein|nr:YchJ family protein [Halobacteriovoraceae bacterium]